MINKVINFAKNLSLRQRQIQIHLRKVELLQKEVIWANVFHDSIRSKDFMKPLSLNIGRWAGNYSFFYILNRILSDYKPERIIEFGLGESSKLISTYLKHELEDSSHTIIEQDSEWKSHFEKSFQLSKLSKVILCPLIKKEVNGFQVNSYSNLEQNINGKYNLYVIDGPFGSERFSRYDIVQLVKYLEQSDNFIIIFDDCDRQGEKDTLKVIIEVFEEKGITIHVGNYIGEKTVTIITSKHNKFYTSL